MSQDGISTVADLTIVIDADTEKFANGIAATREMVDKLATHGAESLGKFDGIFAKIGNFVGGMPSKFDAAMAQLTPIVAQATMLYETAKGIAEKMGVEGFDEVESAFGDLKSLVFRQQLEDDQAALVQTFVTTRQKLAAEADGIVEEFMTIHKSAGTVMSLLADEIRKLTGATEVYFKGMQGASEKGLAYTEKFLEDQLAALRRTQEQMTNGNFDVGLINKWVFGDNPDAAAARLAAQIDQITSKLAALKAEQDVRLFGKFPTEIDESMLGSLDRRTDALRRQNLELEIQRATLGKTAAEAARITEEMRLRDAMRDTPVVSTEALEAWREQLGLVTRNKQAIESYNDAKKRADDAEREGMRQARGRDNITNAMRTELEQLELKIAAQERGIEATARETFIQKQLAAARRANVEMSPEDIAGIEAMADAYEALIRRQKSVQEQLDMIRSANQALTGAITREFDAWTRGGEFSVKRMTASILQEFAKIAFQAAVIKPLLGGGGSGGLLQALIGGLTGGGIVGGGGGDYLSGYVNTLTYGGPRADGGPVEPGKWYMVGERGPELFVPEAAGSIIPNHAMTGAGGEAATGKSGTQIVLNIDARGATHDAVAALEARIPAIAIDAFQDFEARTR